MQHAHLMVTHLLVTSLRPLLSTCARARLHLVAANMATLEYPDHVCKSSLLGQGAQPARERRPKFPAAGIPRLHTMAGCQAAATHH